MLQFFRNNRATALVPLAFYTALLRLPVWLGWHARGEEGLTGMLYDGLFAFGEWDPLWSAIAAAALVFFQAIMWNRVADDFRLLQERSWFPGMVNVMVASALPAFHYLSAPLVAISLLPVVVRKVFKAYKQPAAYLLVFDAAFWTGVMSLVYPPAIFLAVATFVGIYLVRSFSGREQLVFLSGLWIPLFLFWVGAFWFDRGGQFWHRQFDFSPMTAPVSLSGPQLAELAFLTFLLLTVLLGSGLYFRKRLIQVQKYLSVLYWYLAASGLAVLLAGPLLPQAFLPAAPVVGLLLSISFAQIRNRVFAELLHLTLFCVILLIQFSLSRADLFGFPGFTF